MFTMSTSRKKQIDEAPSYHHGNLREALVEEGLKLLESGGTADFSLRELARRVGVSANATYRHFESKEALLAAMAAEGFRRLAQVQMQAMQDKGSMSAAFFASGRAYVDFARCNPGLFRLIFGRFTGSTQSEEMAAAGQVAFDGLRFAVAKILGKAVESREVEIGALQSWSLVHGLSHLVLDGKLDGRRDDVDTLIDAVLGQAMVMSQARGK